MHKSVKNIKVYLRTAALMTALALICCLTAPFSPVSADEERVVRIPCGINDLLKLDENGEPYGYFCNYLNKLAAINGWRYEYVETNWNDAVSMLEDGGIDVLFPTNFSEERTETMEFPSLSCGCTAAGLFALSGSEYNYEDFESWDGVRIAVTRNSSNEAALRQFAEEHSFSYETMYIDAMEDKISALQSGKADMMIFTASNSVPGGELLAVLDATPFYLTVKKGNTELLRQINSAMQQIMTDSPELVSETNLRCLVGENTRVQALTGEEREFMNSGKEVVIGFYVDTEPLAYVRSDGEYCGVYPDLMNCVKENSGLNIRLAPLSRDKSWGDYLISGEIDFYIGASDPVAAMDPAFRTTDTFIEYMSILVTRSESSLSGIDAPTIALTNGRAYWVSSLPKSLGDVQVKFYESAKDCLTAVLTGEVDGTMLNNYEYNYYSKNPRFASLITWENYRFNAKGGLTASADIDPVMFSAVEKSLYCLTRETVDEIVSSNLNMPYKSDFSDNIYAARYVLLIVAILLILGGFATVCITSVRTKQRIALEKVRDNEREHLNILAALSHDYDAIYFVDLDNDTFRVVQLAPDKESIAPDTSVHSKGMQLYIQQRVMPEYKLELLKLSDPDEIKRRFAENKDFAVRYRIVPDESGRDFYEMHFVDAGENKGSSFMVFGIRCVDETAKDELNRRQLLKDALETAERASLAKSDFLSRMSHDMRTPLNAVIGMTAIAEKNIGDTERVKDSLNKISASGKHLLGLVNEVLDMSKIESGSIDINDERFDLAALLNDLVTMISPQIEKHSHTLNTDFSGIVHTSVSGDSLRLQQIFMNILGNAVKYTNNGGIISVKAVEKPASSSKAAVYTFTFADNGIGMSKEYVRHIFEPFTRAEDPRISKIQGTGLGMSITFNLLRMMNGSIAVESEKDKGSVFTVTVPLKLSAAVCESSGTDPSAENKLHSFTQKDYSGKHVLVAEDNALNMEIICEILNMCGLDVTQAENGRVAVERFMESEPGYFDLVFMDLQMPEMNGLEATRAIRGLERPDAATVPIIAITANAFNDDKAASRAAGMNEHLAKPIDFVKLNSILEEFLSQ